MGQIFKSAWNRTYSHTKSTARGCCNGPHLLSGLNISPLDMGIRNGLSYLLNMLSHSKKVLLIYLNVLGNIPKVRFIIVPVIWITDNPALSQSLRVAQLMDNCVLVICRCENAIHVLFEIRARCVGPWRKLGPFFKKAIILFIFFSRERW